MTTTRIAALTAALALTVTPALAAQPDRSSADVGVRTPVEDPQPPATEAAEFTDRLFSFFHQGEQASSVGGQQRPGLGRDQPLRQPVEKRHPQTVLESL